MAAGLGTSMVLMAAPAACACALNLAKPLGGVSPNCLSSSCSASSSALLMTAERPPDVLPRLGDGEVEAASLAAGDAASGSWCWMPTGTETRGPCCTCSCDGCRRTGVGLLGPVAGNAIPAAAMSPPACRLRGLGAFSQSGWLASAAVSLPLLLFDPADGLESAIDLVGRLLRDAWLDAAGGGAESSCSRSSSAFVRDAARAPGEPWVSAGAWLLDGFPREANTDPAAGGGGLVAAPFLPCLVYSSQGLTGFDAVWTGGI